jgi:hypothetical protein
MNNYSQMPEMTIYPNQNYNIQSMVYFYLIEYIEKHNKLNNI